MNRFTRRLFVTTAAAAGVMLAAGPASAARPENGNTAHQDSGRRIPRAVRQWAKAWNTGDAKAMGALFTADGTYTDHAFQASFTGPAGARQWVEITMGSFAMLDVAVKNTFRSGDDIAVTWTFSGTFSENHPFPAPHDPTGKTFSVPATTVISLCGNRVESIEDYYNLANLLRQVGLPAGPFTPPTGG